MSKSKKELDRDSMFRKIMPALADNPFSITASDLEQAVVAPPPPPPGAKKKSGRKNTPPAAPPESGWEDGGFFEGNLPTFEPGPGLGDEAVSALRARLFARSEQSGEADDHVSTINLMEGLVLRHLDEVILRFNCCTCDRCRRDVAAFALSRLPPQYIVAEPDHIVDIEDRIPPKLIFDALVRAVIRVRHAPRH